jgi:hypothetical protein
MANTREVKPFPNLVLASASISALNTLAVRRR